MERKLVCARCARCAQRARSLSLSHPHSDRHTMQQMHKTGGTAFTSSSAPPKSVFGGLTWRKRCKSDCLRKSVLKTSTATQRSPKTAGLLETTSHETCLGLGRFVVQEYLSIFCMYMFLVRSASSWLQSLKAPTSCPLIQETLFP